MRTTMLRLLPALIAAVHVSAHGFVQTVTVAGKSYAGLPPAQGGASGDSAIRQPLDNGGVPGGVNGQYLSCGNPGKPATLSVDAQPGDEITFLWNDGWMHAIGPVMHYMASCGSASCEQFDSAQGRWFKIDQQSYKPGQAQWVQQDAVDGVPIAVTIPGNIAPGNYILRHELIALHNAAFVGGAEFYPSCLQLKIGGSGTGVPAESDYVTFPGAYKADDAGLVIQAYNGRISDYAFPGPAIVNLGGSASPPPAKTPESESPPPADSPVSSESEDSPPPTSTIASPTFNDGMYIPPATTTTESAPTPPSGSDTNISQAPAASASSSRGDAVYPQATDGAVTEAPTCKRRKLRRAQFKHSPRSQWKREVAVAAAPAPTAAPANPGVQVPQSHVKYQARERRSYVSYRRAEW